jgi:hypothetical protein
MYYQYEPEWSWERPGIRAFGRVNGGLVFESCYIVDKHSVPLLSVFYADKAHNRGWSHHPIYRKLIYSHCAYLTHFNYYIYCAYSTYPAYLIKLVFRLAAEYS